MTAFDAADLDAIVADCESRLGLVPGVTAPASAHSARRAAASCQATQAMTDGYARDPAHSACESADIATAGHASVPESSTLQTRSSVVFAYKGIPTTLDALAAGVESLVPPGMPALEPKP